MQLKAILFDLDETIITSRGGDYRQLWRDSIDAHIHLFSNLTAASLYQQILQKSAWYWRDSSRSQWGRLNILAARQLIAIKACEALGDSNIESARRLASHYHQSREFNTRTFCGAIETLQYFSTSPIKTALITNGASDIQRRKIDCHGLDQYFDVVQIEGEQGVGKPEPAAYQHLLTQLGVTPDEAWIVGDNLEWEVRVPQQLGLTTIWHDHLQQGLAEGETISPDFIVNNISELIALQRIADS